MLKSLNFLGARRPPLAASPVSAWRDAGLCHTCDLTQDLRLKRCVQCGAQLTSLDFLFREQRKRIALLQLQASTCSR